MKPFKGAFDQWATHSFGDETVIVGRFEGHPEFHGKWGHSSSILRKYMEDGKHMVETRNSIYQLLTPAEKKVSM